MIKRKWTDVSIKYVALFDKDVRLKSFIFFFLACTFFSCSKEEINLPTNLAELIASKSALELDEVIACAASKDQDNSSTYIYYYPIPGARNIQYFETNSVNVDPNDFANYHLAELPVEDVFGGYLQLFVRSGLDEVYSIVTFESEGKFHKSNPIRLKNVSKPTEYNALVAVDASQTLMPLFSWNDGVFPDNAIYFQVISDVNKDFISGTYTTEKRFQYYKLSNVVLHINREVPAPLILNNQYNFSMLAVSLDNWVNLVVENSFVAQ